MQNKNDLIEVQSRPIYKVRRITPEFVHTPGDSVIIYSKMDKSEIKSAASAGVMALTFTVDNPFLIQTSSNNFMYWAHGTKQIQTSAIQILTAFIQGVPHEAYYDIEAMMKAQQLGSARTGGLEQNELLQFEFRPGVYTFLGDKVAGDVSRPTLYILERELL